jgi:DNA-binding MarR family transcriptional regulator
MLTVLRETEFQRCAAFRLSRARTAAMAHYSAVLRPLGLSPLALYAMGVLADRGTATPSEVAEALDVERSTITALVDRMVRDGLVTRGRHPRHRGKSLLSLTASGQESVGQAYERLTEADQQLDQRLAGGLQALLDGVAALTTALEGDPT